MYDMKSLDLFIAALTIGLGILFNVISVYSPKFTMFCSGLFFAAATYFLLDYFTSPMPLKIALSLVVLAVVGHLAWLLEVTPKPDRDKIQIYLSNAESFSYRGANASNPWKIILPREPIQMSAPGQRAFVFGVANHNEISLENVLVNLVLNPDDRLEVSGDGTDDRSWKRQSDTHFWHKFAAINPQDEHHVWNKLHIKFPNSHEYVLLFEITEKQTTNKVVREAKVLVHPGAIKQSNPDTPTAPSR